MKNRWTFFYFNFEQKSIFKTTALLQAIQRVLQWYIRG